MNQTLVEIVSSLSGGSKNNSKVRGHRDSDDATATDGEPVHNVNLIKHKVSVNDRERMKHYFDKSASMIAPKATDVPIF